MATNTFKIELPDSGNTLTLGSDTTIYIMEMKEIIRILSYNYENQNHLWCPNQSSRNLEVMEIHDEDQEELSCASVTVGILWKDEMKWTGVCKSKMRISPAYIACRLGRFSSWTCLEPSLQTQWTQSSPTPRQLHSRFIEKQKKKCQAKNKPWKMSKYYEN